MGGSTVLGVPISLLTDQVEDKLLENNKKVGDEFCLLRKSLLTDKMVLNKKASLLFSIWKKGAYCFGI
jgi:hypothetical protein